MCSTRQRPASGPLADPLTQVYPQGNSTKVKAIEIDHDKHAPYLGRLSLASRLVLVAQLPIRKETPVEVQKKEERETVRLVRGSFWPSSNYFMAVIVSQSDQEEEEV